MEPHVLHTANLTLPFLPVAEQVARIEKGLPELVWDKAAIKRNLEELERDPNTQGLPLLCVPYVPGWDGKVINLFHATEFWEQMQPRWPLDQREIFTRGPQDLNKGQLIAKHITKNALARLRDAEGNHIILIPVRDSVLGTEITPLAAEEFDIDANCMYWYVGIHWPELAGLAEEYGETRILAVGSYYLEAYNEHYMAAFGSVRKEASIVNPNIPSILPGCHRIIGTMPSSAL